MRKCLLSLLLLASASASVAGVYRWVDEDGRVHFTDKPPQGQGEQLEIEDRRLGTQKAPRSDGVPDRERLLQMYEKQRADKAAQQAKEAKRQAKLDRDCGKVERTLRRYKRSTLYEDRPEGRHYFSPEEKREEMDRLRDLMDTHCDGVPADLQARP